MFPSSLGNLLPKPLNSLWDLFFISLLDACARLDGLVVVCCIDRWDLFPRASSGVVLMAL